VRGTNHNSFFETTPVVERDLANGAGATRVLMRRSEKCPATNSARPSDGTRNRRARDSRGQSAFSPRRFLINALWLAQRGSRTAKCDKPSTTQPSPRRGVSCFAPGCNAAFPRDRA